MLLQDSGCLSRDEWVRWMGYANWMNKKKTEQSSVLGTGAWIAMCDTFAVTNGCGGSLFSPQHLAFIYCPGIVWLSLCFPFPPMPGDFHYRVGIIVTLNATTAKWARDWQLANGRDNWFVRWQSESRRNPESRCRAWETPVPKWTLGGNGKSLCGFSSESVENFDIIADFQQVGR